MPKVQTPMPNKAKVTNQNAISRIISLDELPEDGIKLLAYGHSGTGKTRLVGSFAKAGKLLHLICSSNKVNEARSIRGIANIDVVEIQEPAEIIALVKHARNHDYVSIALDHVTEFGNLILAKILNLEKMPEQSSWGLATQQEYQQMGLQVKEYLRYLLDFPRNVIITGQERAYEVTKNEEGFPLLPYISIRTRLYLKLSSGLTPLKPTPYQSLRLSHTKSY